MVSLRTSAGGGSGDGWRRVIAAPDMVVWASVFSPTTGACVNSASPCELRPLHPGMNGSISASSCRGFGPTAREGCGVPLRGSLGNETTCCVIDFASACDQACVWVIWRFDHGLEGGEGEIASAPTILTPGTLASGRGSRILAGWSAGWGARIGSEVRLDSCDLHHKDGVASACLGSRACTPSRSTCC